MLFKDKPIKWKLMAVILVTSSAVLLLTSAAFLAYELIIFRQSLTRTLSIRAEILAATSTATLAFDNEPEAKELLSTLKADAHIVAASLYDDKGKLFVRYPDSLSIESFPSTPGRAGHRFEKGHLEIFQPVIQADKPLGTLYIKSDLRAMRERIGLYGGIVILVTASSFLVAFGLSNALQQRISRPILALADVAKAVSQRKDYSVRAQKISEDELGLLTDAFNHMLNQIQEREAALRKNEEQLRLALQDSQRAEEEIRRLNAELEQRVLQRTAELAAINRELEAFTSSVSHDLRAPLRHVDAYAQILEEEFSGELSPDAEKYLRRIRQGIQSMGRLVDDLLNLARVGRQELKRQRVPLNDLIDEVLAHFKAEAQQRQIEWRIGELPEAECDPGLMKQVFANLLSNAVKYTRPKDKAIIEVDHLQQDGETVFFVRDNGVGFNMKYVNKLFGVFQRLHRPEEFEGTGVGLATVDRIIRKHHGRIWAEAEEGKGATFYFTLGGSGSLNLERRYATRGS